MTLKSVRAAPNHPIFCGDVSNLVAHYTHEEQLENSSLFEGRSKILMVILGLLIQILIYTGGKNYSCNFVLIITQHQTVILINRSFQKKRHTFCYLHFKYRVTSLLCIGVIPRLLNKKKKMFHWQKLFVLTCGPKVFAQKSGCVLDG